MAKSIKRVIPAILKPILDKRGLTQATILLDWEKIIGPQMSQYALPEKITYYKNARSKGTLLLSVMPGWAPVIEHSKQQIIDKINSYFGYEAIARLQLNQTLYQKKKSLVAQEGKHDHTNASVCTKELLTIEHQELRQALINLKTAILQQPVK